MKSDQWIDVNDEMPDADLNVLVFTGEEVWIGYFDGDRWRAAEAITSGRREAFTTWITKWLSK